MSQADINVKFMAENWPDRLLDCNRVQFRDLQWGQQVGRRRIREVGIHYVDAEGNKLCTTIEYTHADGTSALAVRMLRDGDVAFNVGV